MNPSKRIAYFLSWLNGYEGEVNHFQMRRYLKLISIDYSDGPFESHHCVPQSLGGVDEEYNLLNLPLPIHFIAHRLLRLSLPGSREMHNAYVMMSNRLERKKAKDYAESRKVLSSYLSVRNMGEGNPLYGRKGELSHRYGVEHTDESRRKMSISVRLKSRPLTDSEKHNLRDKNNWRRYIPWKHHSFTESSRQVWSRAEEAHAIWSVDNCGYVKLAKKMNQPDTMAHESMVRRFKLGWVPSECDQFLTWKNGGFE